MRVSWLPNTRVLAFGRRIAFPLAGLFGAFSPPSESHGEEEVRPGPSAAGNGKIHERSSLKRLGRLPRTGVGVGGRPRRQA